jgi:hypothetical protein
MSRNTLCRRRHVQVFSTPSHHQCSRRRTPTVGRPSSPPLRQADCSAYSGPSRMLIPARGGHLRDMSELRFQLVRQSVAVPLHERFLEHVHHRRESLRRLLREPARFWAQSRRSGAGRTAYRRRGQPAPLRQLRLRLGVLLREREDRLRWRDRHDPRRARWSACQVRLSCREVQRALTVSRTLPFGLFGGHREVSAQNLIGRPDVGRLRRFQRERRG